MTLTAAPASTRAPVAAYVVIAAVWAVAITAELSGQGRWLHHGQIGQGDTPLVVSALLFLLTWQLMIIAMMLPSTLPMFRLYRTTVAAGERPAAAQAAFLGGYATVWTAFGIGALALDSVLHHTTENTPWLDTRPWAVTGVLLVLAGAAQFLPLTQACLHSCRHPVYYLFQHYRPGVAGGFRLGRSHGLYCVGCCWALMLVMFTTGMASFFWMAILTTVMTYQKAGRHGARLTTVVGVTLICIGTTTLVAPDTMPGTITDTTTHHHSHSHMGVVHPVASGIGRVEILAT